MPKKLFFVLMVLILTLGILFFAGLHLYTEQSSITSPTADQSPVTQEPVSLELNLSSPDGNKLVFEPDILIQGKATPNSTVLLSSEDKDIAVDITPDGNFTLTLKLVTGINNLTVSAFDSHGNNKSESRTVYYSQEKI